MVADTIDINAAFRLDAKRKKSSGNYRVDFESDALLVNMDAKELNSVFSAGLLQILQKQISDVTETVSPATLQRRQRHRANPGTRSYHRRYAGGRIGDLPPSTSVRKFNDSGRMARHPVVNVRRRTSGQSAAVVNWPANRFDPKTGGNIDNIISDAQRLIPLLRGDIRQTREVGDLIRTLSEGSIAISEAQLREKQRQLRRIQLQIGRRLLGL